MAQAIFAKRFSDCEPNGVLSDICSFNAERVAVSELSDAKYISTENMLPNRGGAIAASSLPTVQYTTSFAPGDVLISNIRPYFKKIVYCTSSGGCSTDVLCFRPKTALLSPYLYFALCNDTFFAYVVTGSKGTKMPRGDKQQIMAYELVVPTDEALTEFSYIVNPLLSTIQNNTANNQRLADLRDTLLPCLMSGKLSVTDFGTAKL